MTRWESCAAALRVLAFCFCSIGILHGCTAPSSLGGPVSGATLLEEPPELTAAQQALLDRRQARIDELLSRSLTAEAAAEIALLQNPAVERALETLEMPGFDRLQIAHTVNPAFNGGRPLMTVETRIERSLSVNVMTWVSVPALDLAFTEEERTPRVQAADEIVALLFLARRAWVVAVAARQSTQYIQDLVAAAQASRDIVRSMREVGNVPELDLLRAEGLYAEAVQQLTTAQVASAVERERLIQTLGLWGAQAERVQLPDRLPDLPAAALGPEGLEARAVSQRFDVRAGRIEGLAGEAGVNARADVRTAWIAYRGAWDLAQHARDAVVPLAERVSEEQLKLYNGMLIGVLDLIADATARITAVDLALAAERDFWLAEVELQRAMSGVGISAVAVQSGVQTSFRPGDTYHEH